MKRVPREAANSEKSLFEIVQQTRYLQEIEDTKAFPRSCRVSCGFRKTMDDGVRQPHERGDQDGRGEPQGLGFEERIAE